MLTRSGTGLTAAAGSVPGATAAGRRLISMNEPASGVGDPAFASASVKLMLPMRVTAPGART